MTFAVRIVWYEKGGYFMYCGNAGRYCNNMSINFNKEGYTKCKITNKQCIANVNGGGNCYINSKPVVERCPSVSLSSNTIYQGYNKRDESEACKQSNKINYDRLKSKYKLFISSNISPNKCLDDDITYIQINGINFYATEYTVISNPFNLKLDRLALMCDDCNLLRYGFRTHGINQFEILHAVEQLVYNIQGEEGKLN